jgi:hypothetical protein
MAPTTFLKTYRKQVKDKVETHVGVQFIASLHVFQQGNFAIFLFIDLPIMNRGNFFSFCPVESGKVKHLQSLEVSIHEASFVEKSTLIISSALFFMCNPCIFVPRILLSRTHC